MGAATTGIIMFGMAVLLVGLSLFLPETKKKYIIERLNSL